MHEYFVSYISILEIKFRLRKILKYILTYLLMKKNLIKYPAVKSLLNERHHKVRKNAEKCTEFVAHSENTIEYIG